MVYTIYKLNYLGVEELSYTGELVEMGEDFVCVRAAFAQKTRDLGYVTLKTGDIFTEWFYSERWYNIFQVAAVDDGELKGYYCNLTRPAMIDENAVKAEDLALDIFVKPDGETLLLDEDDYNALPLRDSERAAVTDAVETIYRLVAKRQAPFDKLKVLY